MEYHQDPSVSGPYGCHVRHHLQARRPVLSGRGVMAIPTALQVEAVGVGRHRPTPKRSRDGREA